MSKKYNLLLPIAGEAKRFFDAGYRLPKPMIPCHDKTIIEYSLSSFNLDEANLIFVVQESHIANFSIDVFLKDKFGEDTVIVPLKDKTEGAICTCLVGIDSIPYNGLPLVIYTPDVFFRPIFDFEKFSKDNFALMTFKANSPDHSYARLGEDGYVVETREKEVISDNAAVGVYYFSSTYAFLTAANEMIENGNKVKGEYYICPIYNIFIRHGEKVAAHQTNKLYVLGTPSELEFYEDNIFSAGEELIVGLCSDHSGFETKEIVKHVLSDMGIEYFDFGCFSRRDCDYVPFVNQAAIGLTKKYVNTCFGFCRTGQGVNMCANKIKHIRSALIYDERACRYAVRHNAANFFAFPEAPDLDLEGKFNFFKNYIEIIQANKFDGGRHYTRISKI